MLFRKIFLLTACFIVGVACSGCTTSGIHTIESDSIPAIVEYPSGSMSRWPLNRGNEIVIVTKENIRISSKNVNRVRMVVDDANTSRIKGSVVYVVEDEGQAYEGLAGIIVEVQLNNIEKIEVGTEPKLTKLGWVGAASVAWTIVLGSFYLFLVILS